ncbi:hypothetical protein M2138_001509 [Dysgonomonadaceae bacterium PH5-43]|nr:hypothetical protein [Dysgonomonadaceae bacterium PH5-43]
MREIIEVFLRRIFTYAQRYCNYHNTVNILIVSSANKKQQYNNMLLFYV